LSYKYNWAAFSGQRTPENMKNVFYNGNIEFFRFKMENWTQNQTFHFGTGLGKIIFPKVRFLQAKP
jgi:hypothetical protein